MAATPATEGGSSVASMHKGETKTTESSRNKKGHEAETKSETQSRCTMCTKFLKPLKNVIRPTSGLLSLCISCRSRHWFESLPSGVLPLGKTVSSGISNLGENKGDCLQDVFLTPLKTEETKKEDYERETQINAEIRESKEEKKDNSIAEPNHSSPLTSSEILPTMLSGSPNPLDVVSPRKAEDKYSDGPNTAPFAFRDVKPYFDANGDLLPDIDVTNNVCYKYGGSITRLQLYYVARIRSKGTATGKWFKIKELGEEKAKLLAEQARIEMSNERGLTTAIYQLPVRDDVAQFVSGFTDGDGYVSVTHKGKNISVQWSQSHNEGIPPILKFIQSIYGGRIHMPRACTKNRRTAWSLILHGFKAYMALRDLIKFAIIKKPQAEVVFNHLTSVLKDRKHQRSPDSRKKLVTAMQDLRSSISEVEILPDRFSTAYLCGFFDAEGSIGQYTQGGLLGSSTVTITQCSCPSILHAMGKILNGRVYSGALKIVATSGLRFLKAIQSYSITKATQISLVLRYSIKRSARPSHIRTEEERQEDEKYVVQLKRLKRT